MEGGAYELTVDDVLALHRSWITDLFVTEGKTEVEIIELLYHQRFVVSVAQLHQCLLDWNLIPLPRADNSALYQDLESSQPSTVASNFWNNTASSAYSYNHFTSSDIASTTNCAGTFDNYVLDDHKRSETELDSVPRIMYNRGNDGQSSTTRTDRPPRKSKKDKNHEKVVRKR